jgi:signal transduction histidine kinase
MADIRVTNEPLRVLLVEDDEDDFYILKHKLAETEDLAYELQWEDTFESGVKSMSLQQHDVYLVDYNLGEHTGLEFVCEAVRLDCKAPVIVMTGQGGHAVDIADIESGATDYLPKGQITADLLARSIRHSIQHKRAEAAVRSLNAELEQRVIERTAQLSVITQHLQRSNQVLQILDQKQQDFIEIAAHELRTPLTVMIGYVGMMKLNPHIKDDKALAELVDGIGKGANRLHEVVNAMLDIRKIDNGGLKVVPEQVMLPLMIDDIVSKLCAEVRETRNLIFRVEYEPALPSINLDPALMRKALHHVLQNAVQYTPDGGKITICVCQIAMADGQPAIEVSVSDTGIGLDSEHHELVFEKFYQVGSAALHSSSKTAFKGGGPGMGLTIARGIVQAHQGKIWIESPGHDEMTLPGSTVYICLPLDVPQGIATELPENKVVLSR